MLDLSGLTAITIGLFIPNALTMSSHNVLVAVAVRAMICTSLESILLISPNLEYSFLKSSPLYNRGTLLYWNAVGYLVAIQTYHFLTQ